ARSVSVCGTLYSENVEFELWSGHVPCVELSCIEVREEPNHYLGGKCVISILGDDVLYMYLFFSSRRRHTRFKCDWSSDVCSSDLVEGREDGVVLYLKSGKQLKTDILLWANGRTGNSDSLNLPAIGIEPDKRGNIPVKIGRASCRERG